MPWMRRGGIGTGFGWQRQWVPAHQVDAMKERGWVEVPLYAASADERWALLNRTGAAPDPISQDLRPREGTAGEGMADTAQYEQFFRDAGRRPAAAALNYMQATEDGAWTLSRWYFTGDVAQNGDLIYRGIFWKRGEETFGGSRGPVGIQQFTRDFAVPGTGGTADEADPNDFSQDPIVSFYKDIGDESALQDVLGRMRDIDVANYHPQIANDRTIRDEVVTLIGLSERRGRDPEMTAKLIDLVLTDAELTTPPGYAKGEGTDDQDINIQIPTGGGGGLSKQPYQPPDRREVEENVKNYLQVVLGNSSDKKLVNRLVDVYMRDHRALYDNPESGKKPWFSVKEQVHQLQDYKRIHSLRPDTLDETEWITRYERLIEEAGIPAGLRDQTAVNFATVGASLPGAARGAYRLQEQRTGRPQPRFLQGVAQVVGSLARKF